MLFPEPEAPMMTHVSPPVDGEIEPVEHDLLVVPFHEVLNLDERSRVGPRCAHVERSTESRRERTTETITPAAVTSTSASESREMTCRDGAIPKTSRAMRTVNQSFEATCVGSWPQHQCVTAVRKHSSMRSIDAWDRTMNVTA